tara:strand:- start:69 stop:446 length:378 start_codon:yes stop_codon:yes gene_type:complete
MLLISKMTTIENDILLAKTAIFESVNRTLFTASGVSFALLASTQTNFYNDENGKNVIRLTGLSMLALTIVYGFYNVSDYKNFLDNYKTKDDNSVININTDNNLLIIYCYLVLLCIVLVSNVSMMM